MKIHGAWRPPHWAQGCYISGPMSGYKSYNAAWFAHLSKDLRRKGWYVINPAEFKHRSWWVCMARDLSYLIWAAATNKIGAIVIHPHWRWSAGARWEMIVSLFFRLCVLTPEEAEHIVPNHGIPIRHPDQL